MTCIIGYLDNSTNDIFMGSDSAGIMGYSLQRRSDEKVFVKNNMIFGFAGSFRMGQILRYSFDIPKKKEDETDYGFLCSKFVDDLIECFKKKGFATVEDNEVSSSGSFLIGFNGALYEVEGDFQVGKVLGNFNSIGAAYEIALGAMSILDKLDIPASHKVFGGLYTSVEFSTAVSKPFNVIRLCNDKNCLPVEDPFSASGFFLNRTNNKL